MTRRETIAEIVLSLGLVVAVAGLWLAEPPQGLDLVPSLLCVGVLAFATRVRFDTTLGFTAPTQLAFIPLLFTVPLALVPVAAVVALAVAPTVDVLQGKLQPARIMSAVGNGWWA